MKSPSTLQCTISSGEDAEPDFLSEAGEDVHMMTVALLFQELARDLERKTGVGHSGK